MTRRSCVVLHDAFHLPAERLRRLQLLVAAQTPEDMERFGSMLDTRLIGWNGALCPWNRRPARGRASLLIVLPGESATAAVAWARNIQATHDSQVLVVLREQELHLFKELDPYRSDFMLMESAGSNFYQRLVLLALRHRGR